ncbi:DsbA family oxidoreductase [Shewanella litorisediminis]|nr:DsbA family protein [Shewanella litorisediminis]MCL2920220.1 DsbA family protein [Shewanella litorisediminis]
MIQIEFFHDAVCGWCYVMSPRLRSIVARYPVSITHRAFVLQRNDQEMIARFGSLALAKMEILQHWQSCKSFADDPGSINIEGMRATSFNYPNGYLSALYAKAVENAAGQDAHWEFFDAVQKAHLYYNQNISDTSVLDSIVKELNLPAEHIHAVLNSAENVNALEGDLERAANFGIKSIPTLLVNCRKLISQSLSLPQLENLIESELSLVI